MKITKHTLYKKFEEFLKSNNYVFIREGSDVTKSIYVVKKEFYETIKRKQ